jgi:hypothetical protein
MSLVEITAAVAILAVLLSAAVQMLRVVSTQQRAAECRAVALQAVQAITEKLGNTPFEKLTPDTVAETIIPEEITSQLPAARLAVTINEQLEPVPVKRIRIELTWNNPGGTIVAPVRLTSWVFPEP